jgi:hypothetical protein
MESQFYKETNGSGSTSKILGNKQELLKQVDL